MTKRRRQGKALTENQKVNKLMKHITTKTFQEMNEPVTKEVFT